MALLVAGCQSTDHRGGPKGTSLPPGSTVTLLQEVTVPAGRARIGLRVAGGGNESGYEPRCLVEVRNVGKDSQAIPAGDYRVKRTRVERTYFADERQSPYLLASTDLLLAGEQPTPMYRVTNIFFEPGQAADLHRLSCSRLGGRESRWVTIAEMRGLLAGVVEFSAVGSP